MLLLGGGGAVPGRADRPSSCCVKDGLGRRRLHAAGLLERLHHDLRLLGRYRPRRHADLGHPLPVPLALAHGGVPLHRGDDGVRGHDRGALPDHPHRAPVDLLLAAAVSQPAVPLAQLQVAADLGRVRDHAPTSRSRTTFLVCRPGPRRRRGARQGGRLAQEGVQDVRARLAGHRQPVAALHAGPTSTSPRWPRRWCSRCTRWCRWDFAMSHRPGLARDDLRALLRGRRDLLRHRHGAHPADPAPARRSSSST